MLIKDLMQCDEFTAGDNSTLRELLHPDKADAHIHYSLAHAVVQPGEKTLPHRLRSSEVYYILEGTGIMHINDQAREVKSDHAIYIPPSAVQYIHNTGTSNLKFICIVDPAWRIDDEEILK